MNKKGEISMNYDKIFENFLDQVQKEGTYATREDLAEATKKMLEIVKANKDSTPEELVEAVIEDNIHFLEDMRNNYPVPGYTVGMKVGNINVKLYGGYMDETKRQMSEDALFDIASITKLYTQIIAYNLIKEGYFSYEDKINDLDPRFSQVGDLTVGDVLTFTTEFKTNGRLSDKETISEAKDCLYNMNVVATGKYNYNDMGMMLMKEVMENVTGKSYEDLLKEYITDKLVLNDTHLVIPSSKIERLTGTPNAKYGMVNDPSALSVGGYSGHAGIKVTSDDLIRLGKGFLSGTIFPIESQKDAYTPGISIYPEGGKANRGIMGNTYTAHEKGLAITYIDKLSPIQSFVSQGSTRTQLTIGPDSVSTILLNPSSMGIERAKEEEAKINATRQAKGQAPLSLVKEFTFDRNGNKVKYQLIDARQMAPDSKTMEPIITMNAITSLRLRFLNEVIKEYDRNYQKEVNITYHK